MSPLRRAGAWLCSVLLLCGGVFANAQEPDTTKRAAPPFNPLGDVSRFTRMGGWGGFGGMIGQFGLSKAMLVTNPAIHEELKLTKEQKEELKDWEQEMRKKGEEMFRNGPNAAGGNAPQGQPGGGNPDAGGNPEAGGNPGGGFPGGFNPLGFLDMITNLVREGETSLAKILTKKQYTRLNQIALQMEGIAALGRDEVAEAVNLAPDQMETIKQLLADNKTSQIGFMMTQALQMRGMARRGQGNGPGQGQGQGQDAAGQNGEAGGNTDAGASAKKAVQPRDEDPEAQAKRRAAMRERMEGQFKKMRDGTDEIQNNTTTKILKVLTKSQRARFEKLLGPPFDPGKFTFPGGPGMGRNRDGDPNAASTSPANAQKKAETPATRSTKLRDARGSSQPDNE